jgi:hypothetical protein
MTEYQIGAEISNYQEMWVQSICKLPQFGPENISQFTIDLSKEGGEPGEYIEALILRKNNKIRGVLFYFPVKLEKEKSGNINIMVHPDHFKKGYGKLLLKEAANRWEINFEQQIYTPSGHKFMTSLFTERDARTLQ